MTPQKPLSEMSVEELVEEVEVSRYTLDDNSSEHYSKPSHEDRYQKHSKLVADITNELTKRTTCKVCEKG